MNTSLHSLGWSEFFERHFQQYQSRGFSPGRITNEQRSHYYLNTGSQTLRAEPSGKVLFTAEDDSELPKTGDWVAFQEHTEGEAIIHAVLQRRTVISRKHAGSDAEQVIAANVDVLFIMQGLDRDFNPRRLERYLVLARSGGVTPVILLNKSDLVKSTHEYVEQVRALDAEAEVLALSALEGDAVDSIREILAEGITGCIVGSSGVGKSTLVNLLLGTDLQATKDVREDDQRGRHTTTSRSLFVLEGGGVLIDTPGMRELAPWGEGGAVAETFADIEELGEDCRYRDCTHTVEAGCAVLAAIEDGALDESRYRNYRKLQKELDYLENTESYRARKERIRKGQKQFYDKMLRGKKGG